MAIESIELAIGLAVGLAIGIVIIYVIMKSRVMRDAQNIASNLVERQKQEFEKMAKDTYIAQFENWKVNHEMNSVKPRIEAAKKQALESSRSTLKGRIGEQIAPLLPDFLKLYEPADARFIGTPIDYIIFKNMSKVSDNTDEPIEIVLLDVKTGTSSLTKIQKMIKTAVESGRVKFDILRPSIAKEAVAINTTTDIPPPDNVSINDIPPPPNYKNILNIADSTE